MEIKKKKTMLLAEVTERIKWGTRSALCPGQSVTQFLLEGKLLRQVSGGWGLYCTHRLLLGQKSLMVGKEALISSSVCKFDLEKKL